VDFTYTRQENDDTLLNRIDAIRKGQDLDVLEPFARAYLGLFYDIDSQVPAEGRIDLLANSDLAAAIKQGLITLLRQSDLPTPDSIARSMLKQETQAVGYAVLAGISLHAELYPDAVLELPDAGLKSAICFHHAISTFHEDSWYTPLLIKKPDLAAEALLSMWRVLLDEKQDFLPGLRSVLKEDALLPLFSRIVVPLLKNWRHCRSRELILLLSRAVHHVERNILLDAARVVLSDTEQMNLRNQVYWHGTAFLLAPEDYGQSMINFMGQEKIKLLPLLDFAIPLLEGHSGKPIRLTAMGYAYLIRCLAQKFTPQIGVNDNLGEITVKVLWLFYQLACFSTEEGGEALTGLRRVRVLKLYSDIFDAIADYQSQVEKPDYQTFMQALRDEGRLRMKKNWHDVR